MTSVSVVSSWNDYWFNATSITHCLLRCLTFDRQTGHSLLINICFIITEIVCWRLTKHQLKVTQSQFTVLHYWPCIRIKPADGCVLYWWPSKANFIAIIQSVTGCELWGVFVSLDWSKFYICTTLLYSISRYFGSYYDRFRSILSRNKDLISPCSKLTVMKWNPRCYSDKAVIIDLWMRHICCHSRNTAI